MSLSSPNKVSSDFRASAAKPRPKTEARKPFCIRLSDSERARLERMAGRRPLGSYSREKLLGEAQEPRKSPKHVPKMDYVLLAKILAALGKSELASSLCLLAVAAESGSLPVTDDVAEGIKTACADVHAMRLDLMKALGLKPEE